MKEPKQTITFKNAERTGRFRSFQNRSADIKLNKKVIGWMSESGFRNVEVWFHVKEPPTAQNPAPFRNVRLKARYSSIEEAKEAVKKNFPQLAKVIDIHQSEN